MLFRGMEFRYSDAAVVRRSYCPWPMLPASRHRSMRVARKIAKRTQTEIVEPAIFEIKVLGRPLLLAHPSYKARFELELRLAPPHSSENPLYMGVL